MIDITIVKGAADKTLGTVTVDLLTSEAEAANYGLYEINSQWQFIDQIGIAEDAFLLVKPFDCVRVNSDERGWDGKTLFVNGVSLQVDENNMCRTAIAGECYESSEE